MASGESLTENGTRYVAGRVGEFEWESPAEKPDDGEFVRRWEGNTPNGVRVRIDERFVKHLAGRF